MKKAKKKQSPKPASKAPPAPEPQPVAQPAPVVTAIATVEPVKDQAAIDAMYPDWGKFDKPVKQTPNHRQRLFIDAYLADPQMNAGRAAKKAGYRGVTAGHQLLKMPVVKAEIEKR